MNSKILLTGATGFIGRHMLSNENIAGCVVREGEAIPDVDNFVISELSGKTNWSGAFESVDTVIHLAGLAHSSIYSEDELNEVNCHSVVNLANSAYESGVRRFVFVSSICVNGTSTQELPYKESSIPCPHNSYAQSKYYAELGLKEIAEKTGLEVVIVRPTLVYGPSAPGNFGLLTRLVNKLPFLPFGLANNRRDFIAVQNLADLLVTCAKHPNAAGHTFLASDGETVSIKEFTNAIAKGLGKKVFQLPIPVTLMRLAGKFVGKSDMIEQLYGNLEVDSSNIKDVLGWTPPLTMKQAMATLRDTGTK
ncbi:NAD-dependent epimerase/dehydratase family protein [Vibrio sp. 3-2(1)]|uniref:NAD-dependent epimerase/dehydratase family protein n=1 Tax=Vibrio sp. 3-2(1) TaxID=2591016 RepID=UPI001482F8B3|nr:NAD-dependent epimerase/dehydratase family protein [Vibrio sp. 3-2(1)]NNN69580.1 NAD-dependent epimerase/dehydratase family protein [Vibrio sp. 3-2(1)]